MLRIYVALSECVTCFTCISEGAKCFTCLIYLFKRSPPPLKQMLKAVIFRQFFNVGACYYPPIETCLEREWFALDHRMNSGQRFKMRKS